MIVSWTAYDAITGALSAVKSDIDILGWYERQSIMGLLVPDVAAANMATICNRLEAGVSERIHTSVGGRIGPTTVPSACMPIRSLGNWKSGASRDGPFFLPGTPGSMGDRRFPCCQTGNGHRAQSVAVDRPFPLLGVIADLVKLSSRGRSSFVRCGSGQMMKPFMMCKFRTMYANADHGVHHSYVSWFVRPAIRKTMKRRTSSSN